MSYRVIYELNTYPVTKLVHEIGIIGADNYVTIRTQNCAKPTVGASDK